MDNKNNKFEQDLDIAVEEILYIKKEVRSTLNHLRRMLTGEQKMNIEEEARKSLIKSVIVRQEIYPEKAIVIMDESTLDALEDRDLMCIIESYGVTEEEIYKKMVG